jgi:hypothetical protein
MSKDELIIDILEKIHEKVEKSADNIQEIKLEQSRQNIIVTQHEARSTASEKRLNLLEKDAQFFRNFITTVTVLAGIAAFLIKILPLVHR